MVGVLLALPACAAEPVNVTVVPETISVTIEQQGAAAVTLTTEIGKVLNVATPGEQGIPGRSPVLTWSGDQIAVDGVVTGPHLTGLAGSDGVRGYDGREIELQNSGTYLQWRYVGTLTWYNLISVAAITGANGTNGVNGSDGKNYTCAITGGIRSLQYDKNGANPAPTMTAFAVELRENGVVVTPATYSWSTPAVSLLSGSGSASTFTPSVAGTFNPATDNRVDVAVTYSGITCRVSAPVPATKVGADGSAGSPDTKQLIYGKINVATTGDVLNTQAGAGDAAGFAYRTYRGSNGNVYQSYLAGGQSFVHADPGDTATTVKFGVKASDGTILTNFQAGGNVEIKGALIIK